MQNIRTKLLLLSGQARRNGNNARRWFFEGPFRAALRHAIDQDKPELLFRFRPILQFIFPASNIYQTLLYLSELLQDKGSPYYAEALEIFREANLAAKTRDWTVCPFSATTDIFYAVAKSETEKLLDRELLQKLATSDPAQIAIILQEIADGKIPYNDALGFNFDDYMWIGGSKELRTAVKERYYLSDVEHNFLPSEPMRDAILKSDPEAFLVAMEAKTDFNPRERAGINAKDDSWVELVAKSSRYAHQKASEKAIKWLEILKMMIAKYDINPYKKIDESSTKTLVAILPEEFWQPIIDISRNPTANIEHLSTLTKFTQNSGCTIL